MTNQDIRLEAAGAGVKLWQIAERLGITNYNFSCKLRNELSSEKKVKIHAIIEELKNKCVSGN